MRLTNLPLLLLFFKKEIHRCLAEVEHVRRMAVGVCGDGRKVHRLRQPYLYMYRSVFLIGKHSQRRPVLTVADPESPRAEDHTLVAGILRDQLILKGKAHTIMKLLIQYGILLLRTGQPFPRPS